MQGVQTFTDFRARPFLIEQMMRPVKAGRIVHAQLFQGPDGVGKRTAAELCARAMNCRDAINPPCNKCPSCLQFLSGNSPNLIRVKPEKNQIKVDPIRDVISKVSLKPNEGRLAVIIEDADKMNENAQNALLKTLEEAPEYAVFFLIAEKAGVLLPTIRSRCQMFRFAPLSNEEVKSGLMHLGISEIEAENASKISNGSIGLALKRMKDDETEPFRRKVLSALKRIKKNSDVANAFLELQDEKDKASEILEIYENTAHRLIRYAFSKANELSEDEKAILSNGINGAKLMEAVVMCAKRLKANVSFQSAMEMLFFDIVSQEDKG